MYNYDPTHDSQPGPGSEAALQETAEGAARQDSTHLCHTAPPSASALCPGTGHAAAPAEERGEEEEEEEEEEGEGGEGGRRRRRRRRGRGGKRRSRRRRMRRRNVVKRDELMKLGERTLG